MGRNQPAAPAPWVEYLARQQFLVAASEAVLCKPNAPGRFGWPGGEVFGQRQVLKAAGRYLAERVVLALTPTDVWVAALNWRGRPAELRRWPRSGLDVSLVPARGAPRGDDPMAFLIRDRATGQAVELKLLESTPRGLDLIASLMMGPATSGDPGVSFRDGA